MSLTAQQLVAQAKAAIEEIDAGRLLALQAEGVPIIDVREPAEYAAGHVPGAVNLPRGVLEFEVDGHPAVNCARDPAPGAWAAETIEAESRLREDRFSTVRRPIADAMGQESAEICTAQTALQPGRLLQPTLLSHRERPVVLYCRSGGRSALAAESLKRLGFAAPLSLAGGFLGWCESGRPVEQDG